MKKTINTLAIVFGTLGLVACGAETDFLDMEAAGSIEQAAKPCKKNCNPDPEPEPELDPCETAYSECEQPCYQGECTGSGWRRTCDTPDTEDMMVCIEACQAEYDACVAAN